MAKNNPPKSVLIIRFSAIGDVAMAIAETYRVAIQNPHVNFFFLSRPWARKIAVNHPPNLHFIGVDLQNYKGIHGLWRLFKELNSKYHFDAVADLHSVIRSKILSLAARLHAIPSASIHKDRKARKALTRKKNKILAPLKPVPQKYQEVFQSLSLDSGKPFSGIFSHAAPDPLAFAKASSPKIDSEKWIAIAPFARHDGKIYPLDLMEKVVEELSKIPHAKIFLLGAGKKEEEILQQWTEKYPHCINLAALRLGFSTELAILYYCDILLSMDSANMHLASLAGTRTISIWGATHPFAGFAGIGQSPKDFIQTDLPCRPCSIFGNKKCRLSSYPCLRQISPRTILTHLLRHL